MPIFSRFLCLFAKGWARRIDALFEAALLEYPYLMAGKWVEIAQKMAQAARAGLAIERKRLNEILADRLRSQSASSGHSSR